jgi:hypothetical protein
MMKRETNVDVLKKRIEHHGATDKDWETAKQQLESERKEREQEKIKAAEARRLWEKEQAKPENFVKKHAPCLHVEANRIELENQCQKCDLTALKAYTTELASGKHVSDFRGKPTAPIVQFLQAQIARRDTNNKSELITTIKHAEKSIAELNDTLEGKPSRSKAYTT